MNPSSKAVASEPMKEIEHLFEARGSTWYGGEAVSQLEHALQAAMFAERGSAPTPLIVAALLHDVGHLLHGLSEDVAQRGVDDRHEMLGTEWLSQRFIPAVVEPVGMHVAAKRYLCAVDAGYLARLSPASQQSLRLQGGSMTRDEVGQFENRAFFIDAVSLRKWDDAAKVVGLETPRLDHFAQYVHRVTLIKLP